MSNILIAYFSRAGENYFGGEIRPVSIGNTKICAELLKESLDADAFEIEMKAPYSDNYRECVAQAREDLQKNHLPELKTMPEIIADYDVVILGYPNYCSTIPMPVATFLDAYDFSGKKILPFCTNEGSGMGVSEADIKKYAPGADVEEGLSVNGSKARESKKLLEDWVKKLLG